MDRLDLFQRPVGTGEAAASDRGADDALVLAVDPASPLKLDAHVLGTLLDLTPAVS